MSKTNFYVTGVLAVVIFVLLNLIGSNLHQRFDLTKDKLYTLSSASIEILKLIEEPITITHFYIASDPRYGPTLELLRDYERRSRFIATHAYDVNTNPSIARNMGVQFQGTTILVMGDRREEVYGGDEVSITNGIYRLLVADERIIYFTDGHGEYDIHSIVSDDHLELEGEEDRPIFVHEKQGLAKLRERLELTGVRTEKLYLQTTGKVPPDADLVIIASPSDAFRATEIEALDNYLQRGGRLFVMLDAFRDAGLGDLLSRYGIGTTNDIVVDFGNHFWNDATAPATGSYERHPITMQLPLTFFPGAQSLRETEPLNPDFSTTILFSTTDRSISVPDINTLNSLRNADLPTGRYPLMIISEQRGQSESRSLIAVIGDGDVASNANISVFGNERLIMNTINWLLQDESRISLPPVNYELPVVNLTNTQMRTTFLLTTVLLPAIFVIAGIIVWVVRRKNK